MYSNSGRYYRRSLNEPISIERLKQYQPTFCSNTELSPFSRLLKYCRVEFSNNISTLPMWEIQYMTNNTNPQISHEDQVVGGKLTRGREQLVNLFSSTLVQNPTAFPAQEVQERASKDITNKTSLQPDEEKALSSTEINAFRLQKTIEEKLDEILKEKENGFKDGRYAVLSIANIFKKLQLNESRYEKKIFHDICVITKNKSKFQLYFPFFDFSLTVNSLAYIPDAIVTANLIYRIYGAMQSVAKEDFSAEKFMSNIRVSLGLSKDQNQKKDDKLKYFNTSLNSYNTSHSWVMFTYFSPLKNTISYSPVVDELILKSSSVQVCNDISRLRDSFANLKAKKENFTTYSRRSYNFFYGNPEPIVKLLPILNTAANSNSAARITSKNCNPEILKYPFISDFFKTTEGLYKKIQNLKNESARLHEAYNQDVQKAQTLSMSSTHRHRHLSDNWTTIMMSLEHINVLRDNGFAVLLDMLDLIIQTSSEKKSDFLNVHYALEDNNGVMTIQPTNYAPQPPMNLYDRFFNFKQNKLYKFSDHSQSQLISDFQVQIQMVSDNMKRLEEIRQFETPDLNSRNQQPNLMEYGRKVVTLDEFIRNDFNLLIKWLEMLSIKEAELQY